MQFVIFDHYMYLAICLGNGTSVTKQEVAGVLRNGVIADDLG